MRYFFARLGEKHKLLRNFEKILEIFDDNSIEKLNFYLFLGKVVAKNRALGNNIIFLQQFFPVRGGVQTPLPPPAYATDIHKGLLVGWYTSLIMSYCCKYF